MQNTWKSEREIMNGQWLCIKLNMKNWAYRSANITTAALLKVKKINKRLRTFFMYDYEWKNKIKNCVSEGGMNGSMLLYVKEISLAVQKGLTMLLLHFIIPHDTWFSEYFNPILHSTTMTLYGAMQWIIVNNYDKNKITDL